LHIFITRQHAMHAELDIFGSSVRPMPVLHLSECTYHQTLSDILVRESF